MDVVQIGGRRLDIGDLGRVAAGASVEMHPSAVSRISAARAVVDEALSAMTEDRSVARVHESVRKVVRSLPGAGN